MHPNHLNQRPSVSGPLQAIPRRQRSRAKSLHAEPRRLSSHETLISFDPVTGASSCLGSEAWSNCFSPLPSIADHSNQSFAVAAPPEAKSDQSPSTINRRASRKASVTQEGCELTLFVKSALRGAPCSQLPVQPPSGQIKLRSKSTESKQY